MAREWLFMAAVAGVFSVGGCAGPGGGADGAAPVATVERGEGGVQGGVLGTVNAEWDDVDAAVRFAAREHSMAVVRRMMDARTLRDARSIDYELMTIRDEPARIRVERDDAGADIDARRTLTLHASVGRFDDRTRSAAVIETLRSRLGVLAEREIAPAK